MRRVSFIVLFAACCALMGCGGDDSKPDDSKPPPDAGTPDAGTPDAGRPDSGTSLDLVPPMVTGYSPADGAIAVPPESFIEVSFSEPMQPSRGTMTILPGTDLPNGGVVTARPQDWDVARRKVTFTFPQGLPLRAKLTVTLSDFADDAGNPLQAATTFSFTVSDGKPPRVTSASPIENANQVPLTLAEVSFSFNEPMDPAAGRFVPGGGLSLGPISWVGNQVVKATVTSPLVYNGIYSVRLEGFRNANGKELDGIPYLGDGKLDFGTGEDLTVPTVTSVSPAEGSTGVLPEDTSLIVFTFSEPMDKTLGKAELVDGTTRTVLTPIWSDDGFNVSYDVVFKLRHDAPLKVALSGFKDRAGNALDPKPVLGDGALDFRTAPDTIKPYLLSANPPDGTQDVYPVEVYATGGSPATGWRKVFTFRFSEPMNPSFTRVTLHEANNPNSFRNLDGAWSGNNQLMTLTITPAATGQLPLLADFAYYLDLRTLRDRNGNLLDTARPGAGDGRIRFRTLTNFPQLNHACEHALTVTPTPVTATGSVTASTPRTDVVHTRYEVSLPSNGTSFSGHTRSQLPAELFFYVFLDRNVELTVINPTNPGAGVNVTQQVADPACSAITHVASFITPDNPEQHLRFISPSDSKFRLIIEYFN